MHDNKANDLGVELQGIFIPASILPQRIFENAFGRYLFFDADLRSSDALISTLHDIAKVCLGENLKIGVFASSSRILLGRLDANSNWIVEINEINKMLRRTGDTDGLILVDASQKWVVCQKRPVDLGIFAFDCTKVLPDIESAMADCFFGCSDIANWLVEKTPRDIDLVNNFGRNYLAGLVRNYGGTSCSVR